MLDIPGYEIEETLISLQGELYQAYLVARKYVQNDEELFK